MKTTFGWLVASCLLVLLGSYLWLHRNGAAEAVAAPAVEPPPATMPTDYMEAKEARLAAPVAGPLASYMQRQKPSGIETVDTVQPVRGIQPVSTKVTAFDHVGGSVVGTSSDIVHQTFGVAKAVSVAFEVPAHAATPQLRGTYRSFLKPAGAPSDDLDGDVEFLVLNAQQYGDFASGHAGEAVFSAEDSHSQEANVSLPPTRNQAVKYYLIFRNNSPTAGKKFVQADFHIDF
jgi:hypothetical protein